MHDWGLCRIQAVTLMQSSRSGSIPSSSNALACSLVGSEASRNRLSGRPGREAWFSVSVPRSASSIVRLWAGRPSGVRLSAALAFALSETLAGSTGELRCARAPPAVVVLEQERRQAPAHVPLPVTRKHAKEHVGADVILRPDMDRPDPQPRGLHREEHALHLARPLQSATAASGPSDADSRLVRTTWIPSSLASASIRSRLRAQSIPASCTAMSKCFSTLRRLASRPRALIVRSRCAGEHDLRVLQLAGLRTVVRREHSADHRQLGRVAVGRPLRGAGTGRPGNGRELVVVRGHSP